MSHSPLRMIPLLLGGILSACSDSNEPKPDPTFTLSPQQQWSGGEVRIASTLFSGGGSLPTILAGSTALAATRIDDTTAAVILSEGPSATVTIYVRDGGKKLEAGEVQVAGMRSRQEALGMAGEVYPVRNHLNQPGFLGAKSSAPNGLVFLPVGTLVPTIVPGFAAPGAVFGVGITAEPDHFIVRDTTGLISEWNLFPTPVFVDSVPPPNGSARQIAQLSDSIWLYTSSHNSYTKKGAVGQLYFGPAESPGSLHLSATAHRALSSSNGYAGIAGIPVFDTETGDTSYIIPVTIPGQQPSNEYAVFSSAGDYLTVLSGPYGAPNLLIRVDAATGAILATDSLPAGVAGIALALDGSGDRLLAYALRNNYPVLYVLDAATLALLGTLSIPAVAENECDVNAFYCWNSAIIVDDVAHLAYVALPQDVTRVYAFDLLP